MDHLDNTATVAQLSFEVGGKQPDQAVIRISGSVHLDKELKKGDEIHLTIGDMDGEVVANGYGRITQVAFKDQMEEGQVVATERIHTAKVA